METMRIPRKAFRTPWKGCKKNRFAGNGEFEATKGSGDNGTCTCNVHEAASVSGVTRRSHRSRDEVPRQLHISKHQAAHIDEDDEEKWVEKEDKSKNRSSREDRRGGVRSRKVKKSRERRKWNRKKRFERGVDEEADEGGEGEIVDAEPTDRPQEVKCVEVVFWVTVKRKTKQRRRHGGHEEERVVSEGKGHPRHNQSMIQIFVQMDNSNAFTIDAARGVKLSVLDETDSKQHVLQQARHVCDFEEVTS